MKKNKVLAILMLLSLITACDPGMIYDQFYQTGDNKWEWGEKFSFEVEMDNTNQYYNIYLNIRHTKDYPKSNLYVFLNIQGPDNAISRDTIDIPIAGKHGNWLGKGFGDIKFVRKKIRENVRFSYPGTYTFSIEQGMRLSDIPVTDVGLRIEKYQKIN